MSGCVRWTALARLERSRTAAERFRGSRPDETVTKPFRTSQDNVRKRSDAIIRSWTMEVAMNDQQDRTDFDTADVWRAAQERRGEDFGSWLGAFIEKRRLQTKAKEPVPAYPVGHVRPV